MPAPASAAVPLPPLILVTDRHQATRPLLDIVAAAVSGGLRLVIVREKDLPAADRLELARLVRERLAPAGGRVLLSGHPATEDGCHLAATDPWPGPVPGLLGRSCHHPRELAAAAAAGAHYATLSPLFTTASKPGYGPPLTVPGFRAAVETAPLPVFALGGITTPERARQCRRAGAAGVAVMGALMRAQDPATLTRDLIAAVTAPVTPPMPADACRCLPVPAGAVGRPAPVTTARPPTSSTSPPTGRGNRA